MARTREQLLAENRALRARIRQLERGTTRRGAHAARFQALTEASLLMNAPLSLDDTLRVVTEEARRMIGADAVATSIRVDGPRSPALRVRSRSRRETGRPEGPRARLAAPLTGRDGRRLGTIRLSRAGRVFTGDDHAVLVQLAQIASLAVENGRLHEAARARVREQAALLEVGRAVTRTLDVREVVRTVLEAAESLVPGCATELWEVVPGTGELRALETRGFASPPPGPLRLGEGLVGAAGATGRPVTSPEVREDVRFVRPEWAAAEGLVSGVCLPLRHAGTLFGTLGLFTRSPHRFTAEEVDRLEALGNQAAAAISNARLYAEATRRRREAEQLGQVARALSETLDVGLVSERIVDAVQALFDAPAPALRLLDPDGSLRAVAGRGFAPHFELGHRSPPGVGTTGRAVAEGRAVWTRDTLDDPDIQVPDDIRRRLLAAGYRSGLAVPLRVKGRIIGTLSVTGTTVRDYSPDEVLLLEAFADQAALALENARLTTLDASWRAIHEDGSPFRGEEHPAMVTLRTGRPCTNVVLGLPRPGGAPTWISINTQPLQREGEPRPYAVVASFTDITEHRQAERERTELLDRVITAQEEERRRVARELHGQMGQDLTALLLGLTALEQSLVPPAGRRARELQEMVKQLMQGVGRLAWELRPTALDDWGLETALRRYAEEWSRRAGVPVDFHSNGLEDRRVRADIATAVYRIGQEALTNVFRHAAASRASVLLDARPDHIQMIVDDDGQGFEVAQLSGAGSSPRRLGLLGMQERVWLVGGTLTIESEPGAGTTVFVRIPLPRDQAAP